MPVPLPVKLLTLNCLQAVIPERGKVVIFIHNSTFELKNLYLCTYFGIRLKEAGSHCFYKKFLKSEKFHNDPMLHNTEKQPDQLKNAITAI